MSDSINDCINTSTDKAPLDPKKRLNYEFGMVLGVNDFRQEQAHHEWKHRLSNRLLHGSGTVCGLKVSAKAVTDGDGNRDVEIHISPGYAITPKGDWIVVEKEQCGQLNQWLQRHKNDLNQSLEVGQHRVFVTLCYDECLTELVPIAGQACASNEDSAKPSRILESFKIEFAWQAPEQLLEDNVRAFGELMQKIEFIPESSPPVSDDSERLIELVRNLREITSPPLSSPPEDITIQLFEENACETLRQALNVWVTEVCPSLTSMEDCVLLAAIDFNIDENSNLIVSIDEEGNLIPDTVIIDESERPVIIPDRLKQELFCLFGRRT